MTGTRGIRRAGSRAGSRAGTWEGGEADVDEDFEPEVYLSPGQVLRAELDARGWSQADLAARTGLSAKHVNHVVQGVAPLSTEVALTLERTLGVRSRVWNALEAAYRDAALREREQRELAVYADWLDRFPLKELSARGVLDAEAAVGAKVAQLLAFFGVSDVAAWERLYSQPVAAFRRAQHLEPNAASTAVWLRLAEQAAGLVRAEHSVSAFSSRALKQRLKTLRALTEVADVKAAFAELQSVCASAGVVVVYVSKIAKTGVQGATRWIGEQPVVALSDRYDYADVFWYSLFHELGHVLLHPRRTTYVSLVRGGDDEDGLEGEADRFAADLLIPTTLIARLRQLSTTTQLQDFAIDSGIAPGIVAGRYGYETHHWSVAAKLRTKVNFSD